MELERLNDASQDDDAWHEGTQDDASQYDNTPDAPEDSLENVTRQP